MPRGFWIRMALVVSVTVAAVASAYLDGPVMWVLYVYVWTVPAALWAHIGWTAWRRKSLLPPRVRGGR